MFGFYELLRNTTWMTCRVNWAAELEQHSITAEVRSSQGHLLFKGLTAKVGRAHAMPHAVQSFHHVKCGQ